MFLGGAALEGPRYIWWNFVSSRRDRIEAAKADWKSGQFKAVPGETEFLLRAMENLYALFGAGPASVLAPSSSNWGAVYTGAAAQAGSAQPTTSA